MNQALQSLRREDLTAHAETYTELGAIRAAQGRDREAEATLRDALDTIAGTDYDQIKIIAGLGLAEFLADRGRSEEAAQLAETFGELAHTHGWKRFDGQLARIAELLETRARPT